MQCEVSKRQQKLPKENRKAKMQRLYDKANIVTWNMGSVKWGKKVTTMNQSAVDEAQTSSEASTCSASLLSASLKIFIDCVLKPTFNNQRTPDKVYHIGVHTTAGSESERKTQQRSMAVN